MKTLIRALILLFIISGIGYWQWSTDRVSPSEAFPGEEETANDWLFRQRAYPVGRLDQGAYRQAVRHRRTLQVAQRNQLGHRSIFTTQWVPGGPLNVGGRITDVEMVPGAVPTIYAGAASGGIFRSQDMGNSWTPIFDDAPSLAIGDLALAPSDPAILYAGTGEGNAGGGSIAYDGLGVYRSDDGGDSWSFLGLEKAGSIGRIAVDPNDPDRAYVAAMGTLFAHNAERGVYRTIDGGASWEQVLFVSDSTGAIDLALHPEQPNVLYAALWERIRRPDYRQYTGATSGIFKSTDGGDTWQELTNGLPSDPADKGRIGLAIAPADPNRIYAAYAGEGGFLVDIFQSTDGGASWSPLGILGIYTVPFEWWFNRLVVSPANPEKVYYIGFELNEYQPGNSIWQIRFPHTHVDQHTLWIHPEDPDFMLLGNDGGLYFSQDGGQTYSKWENLPITQFYTCELDYQFPQRLYGGSQDNGTVRTLTGNFDDWERIFGGDGFRVLVDPTDNTFIYAESQYGNLGRSTNGGASFLAATTGINTSRRNWSTPVILDPANPQILYYGAERVYRSPNRAQSWTAISPDLTDGPGGGNLVYGTITALSVSPLDNQVIWAGTDDGNVWVTDDGGGSWTNVQTGLPDRWVTSLTADPDDPAAAYLTFSGYRFGSDLSHVYRTMDQGQSWTDISGDLPDIPLNDLVVNPANGALYLASDVGVFFSENQGVNWYVLGEGLPSVVVTDLTFHPPSGTLLAATYGRSMWSVSVDELSTVGGTERPSAGFQVAPNPFAGSTTVQLQVTHAGRHSLILSDANGKPLRELFSGHLVEGEHQWSLSEPSLARGVYWVTLASPLGNQSLQIIKQ